MIMTCDGDIIRYNPFQEKLIAILRDEFGKRNILIDGYEITIYEGSSIVNCFMGDGNAAFYCTLTTKEGKIFSVPVGEISDYMDLFTAFLLIPPSLYKTASEEYYVPHYIFCFYAADIENKSSLLMVIDNLCFMARSSSNILNDRLDELKTERDGTADAIVANHEENPDRNNMENTEESQ